MATELAITCVNKTDRFNPHERIRAVGGTSWKRSQQEVIGDIESGRYSFHVTRGGRTVRVIVAVSRFGNKYIKTEDDGEQPDNLLSLPECP